MKTRVWMMVWSIIGMLATQSMGQAPVITSFERNGQLSWANAVNSNALYRVEWAAQAGVRGIGRSITSGRWMVSARQGHQSRCRCSIACHDDQSTATGYDVD